MFKALYKCGRNTKKLKVKAFRNDVTINVVIKDFFDNYRDKRLL